MVSTQFVQHMAEHGLSYGTIEEFNFRLELFSALDEEINTHNNSNQTYTLGHNFMSSWTAAEKKRLNGYIPSGDQLISSAPELTDALKTNVELYCRYGNYGCPTGQHCHEGQCYCDCNQERCRQPPCIPKSESVVELDSTVEAYSESALPEPTCVAEAGACSSWDDSMQCCPGTECYLETACMKTTQTTDAEVNWVTKGAVTPVKNQGQCGSCWAFSSTGALEGAHFIAGNTLTSFSEEQLVECSTLNHGCNGGSMALAFKYYKSHDASLESEYSYTSSTGKSGYCKYDMHSKTKVEVSKFSMITPKSPNALKAAITKGPVSVAIEADKTAFQSYKKGVITGSKCGTKLDHGVLAVGYGSEDGQDYYLVKNSWGPTWGDDGYVKIGIKHGKGVCGIQEQPVQPYSN